jgi:signal transduction histidine kinase
MHKRVIIVSLIILAGLAGLCALGYYSIGLHAEGLTARRANEFVAVAEQIRLDVKRKLDDFIKAEENRRYTDYQYSYVPYATNDISAIVRSPLADNLYNGLAYGYFQLESDGTIISPYNKANEIPADSGAKLYIDNVKGNLIAALAGNGPTIGPETIPEIAMNQLAFRNQDQYAEKEIAESKDLDRKKEQSQKTVGKKVIAKTKSGYGANRRGDYRIPTFDEQQKQTTQVITRSRSNVERNISNSANFDNTGSARQRAQQADYGGYGGAYYAGSDPSQRGAPSRFGRQTNQPAASASAPQREISRPEDSPTQAQPTNITVTDGVEIRAEQMPDISAQALTTQIENSAAMSQRRSPATQTAPNTITLNAAVSYDIAGLDQRVAAQSAIQQSLLTQQDSQVEETVQIRIEPFTPIVVAGPEDHTEFPGQVFLLRHVQIEQKHFLQGFKLNEDELVKQVADSADRYVLRRDMGFDVGCEESPLATHTATLDFGFGELILNLFELKPNTIANQVSNLKKGFFAIVGVVFLAVMIAQASLWRTAREQIKLAKKKDDFISAVSHELRTPLTTIRMHTEMLEKGWIKSEDKKAEYYSTMRQESERLSRLIDNVLDFSRIQRGRKKYNFKLGDINHCIGDVVDMMTPCATKAGFKVEKDFAPVPQFAFDPDAVMQIVINLLDNAVKYANNADEKVIHVRTKCDNGYVLIEVEDHGPGVPRLQRQKVFDEFYRCADESRRETTGTGLGLALVKRFAQAHNGFVEILTARPTGAIFRVALTTEN